MKLPYGKCPDGYCLPAALANIFGDGEFLESSQALAQNMNKVQWDFHHANILLAQYCEKQKKLQNYSGQSLYLETMIAMENFVTKSRFDNHSTIKQLAAHRSNGSNHYVVFVLEVQSKQSTHAVGCILDVDTGMVELIDPAKDSTSRGNTSLIFSLYHVEKVAVLKDGVESIALFTKEAFLHIMPFLKVV